jgi:diguanylate cyclase (GGDEF)-like protein
MMMDLDKVHVINVCHGSVAGDQIIIAVADLLRGCVRPGDIVARLSGDEFAVLLPDTDGEDAKCIAERIRKAVSVLRVAVPKTPGSEEKIEIEIKTSIGIAVAPTHATTVDNLMFVSDRALRKAKEEGRNRVELAE